MEVCIAILALMILGPIFLKLLKGLFRALGPLLVLLIAGAIALGFVTLVFNLVTSLISGAVDFATGPVGLLLILGGGYLGYREFRKRQQSPPDQRRVYHPEKRKRDSSRLELGDDGEIVTLDELLDDDEDLPKQKRGG